MTLTDPAAAPPMPLTSLQSQTSAVARHVVTAAGTAFTVLAALGFLPSDKAQIVVMKLQDLGEHLTAIVGDVGVLVAILGPVAVGFAMKGAALASSLKGQLSSITRNPEVKIEGKIVAPTEVANAVPSPQVVPPGVA